MPHMGGDPDMGHDVVEHPDFSYQHVLATVERTGDSNNFTAAHSFDPLETEGGLSQSEVAELVGIRRTAHIAPDEVGNIDFSGHIEHRGVVGSNLSSTDDELLRPGETIGTSEDVDDIGGSADLKVLSRTDSAVFDHYRVDTITPGGGGAIDAAQREINFRSDMWPAERGPVLDASDTVNVVQRLVPSNVGDRYEANVRMTLIWDTTEVEGTRRQFSLPDA